MPVPSVFLITNSQLEVDYRDESIHMELELAVASSNNEYLIGNT